MHPKPLPPEGTPQRKCLKSVQSCRAWAVLRAHNAKPGKTLTPSKKDLKPVQGALLYSEGGEGMCLGPYKKSYGFKRHPSPRSRIWPHSPFISYVTLAW